jgi:hypothetical protein
MKPFAHFVRHASWIALAAVGIATPVMAQDKPAAVQASSVNKVLVDNAYFFAGESTWAPGTRNASATRPPRIIRALNGGTLTVVYADGRTEKRNFETGQVYFFEADTTPNFLRNDGPTEIKVYYVFLKQM